ncbi:MAG: hypothetical protein ACTH2U_11110 [Brevibacterium sp.]
MKRITIAALVAASFVLAGCSSPAPAPTQGGMAVETAPPAADPVGGAPDADPGGRAEGSFGETLTGDNDIEATVTYRGFQDPGSSAYPSDAPAPVFEVAVKNGSDMTIGQGLVIFQASYGDDQVTDAEIVCGDTEAFSCDTNSTLRPGQSTAVSTGYAIPVDSEVHLEVQVYFDGSDASAEFAFDGTAD